MGRMGKFRRIIDKPRFDWSEREWEEVRIKVFKLFSTPIRSICYNIIIILVSLSEKSKRSDSNLFGEKEGTTHRFTKI